MQLEQILEQYDVDIDIAGVSTDFKGTYVVIDGVAIASFGFSDEEYEVAKKLTEHINNAFSRRLKKISLFAIPILRKE